MMSDSDSSDWDWRTMSEIVPNLWVGDLSAALAADVLEAHNIQFIISAMRGRVRINPVSPELHHFTQKPTAITLLPNNTAYQEAPNPSRRRARRRRAPAY
jgi:hypothetical protein